MIAGQPKAVWWRRRNLMLVPGYDPGLLSQREVAKHRAEDRSHPLKVDTIRMRLALEKVK